MERNLVSNGLKVSLIYLLLMCLLIKAEKRVAAIRALGADIAIDLSGWTSNHFLAGFMARLAPIQVNYLGYFASSGLNEMDYWLGDHNLFPHSNARMEFREDSSFKSTIFGLEASCILFRNHRSVFLRLPAGPIRFGSFNHNRKMSDQTITLWGKDSSGCS